VYNVQKLLHVTKLVLAQKHGRPNFQKKSCKLAKLGHWPLGKRNARCKAHSFFLIYHI
jgi:hypothetical protein